MREILDFLVSARVSELASDPKVLFLAGVLFLVAVFMRWKVVLLSLFGIGAVLAVARYSGLAQGHTAMDRNMVVFSVGTLLVGVVLIYFLFIKGD
ncbi:MAG: hypothetical protein Kow00128_07760 [Deltaproteobacteria bacterium]